MRTAAYIFDVWESGGPYVGDKKPHSIVTVEESYTLQKYGSLDIGTYHRGPVRWFQRLDTEGQVETIIPNVQRVEISRGLDAASGSMKFVVANTKMEAEGTVTHTGQFGLPGFFGPSYGESTEAQDRWDQEINLWRNVLSPNALIRTYQGFGGHDKTLEQCLTDGNLIQTGAWFVDDVNITTDGKISINCRDTAKLLIEQPLYPPLCPRSVYPIHYYRWDDTNQIQLDTHQEVVAAAETNVPLAYNDSTSDEWNGSNGPVLGHLPSDSLDGDKATYWLSTGWDAGNHVEWIEYTFSEQQLNKVYLYPFGGGYEVYISVYVDGAWQTGDPDLGVGGTVPNDTEYTGTGHDTNIPFVFSQYIEWEQDNGIALPGTYNATKIRFSFTNLQITPWAPDPYHCGVRETRVVLSDAAPPGTTPLAFAMCTYPLTEPGAAGYWQARSDGNIQAFGLARLYGQSSDNGNHDDWIIAIHAAPDGLGYYTLDLTGKLISWGGGTHLGDIAGDGNAFDFALTPSGDGYWILQSDGTISRFGDADDLGNASPSGTMPSGDPVLAHAIESHPTDQGYWVLMTDGTVEAHGACTHYGDANRTGFTETEYVASLRRTSTGLGYWIPSGSGIVQAFGDAPHLGNAIQYPFDQRYLGLVWDMCPYWVDDYGYALQHADGSLAWFGDFEWFGDFASGTSILRAEGNLTDYVDIIKDVLLWSGWFLYDPGLTEGHPVVFGNVESTGAYPVNPLPYDMFDKKMGIDVIKEIASIVGYLHYVNDFGGFVFDSPNVWAPGNFDEDGVHTDTIPEIDEAVTLIDYAENHNDKDARSQIIIATEDPAAQLVGTKTIRYRPGSIGVLRGMVRPAMIVNHLFHNDQEMLAIAELIALRIWFTLRAGSTTCVANPAIGIDDQVRIFERQTASTYIHYVTAANYTHDLVSGEYTMKLESHWMGDQDRWAVTESGVQI